jgi:hypothetical protein
MQRELTPEMSYSKLSTITIMTVTSLADFPARVDLITEIYKPLLN